MTAFTYQNGVLHADTVDLRQIAREMGTPSYVYSSTALQKAFVSLRDAFGTKPPLICYAMKANSNLAVVRQFAQMGAGMDIVSGGEFARALKAGVLPERIVFSGVGKTRCEMAAALSAGILCFNVESEPELETLAQLATEMGRKAPVSIRVNPDVSAGGHKKISTGSYHNKFGIPIEDAPRLYRKIMSLPGLEAFGVDMHIGSQLLDLAPLGQAIGKLAALTRALRQEGVPLRHIDIGGGLGIDYGDGQAAPPEPKAFAALVEQHLADLDLQIVLEPGRFLVGNAGVLLTKVIYVKQGAEKTFVIVDAAMNDLIRPTLYNAFHAIKPILTPEKGQTERLVDVVGPVCESGDFLAEDRPMPPLEAGDLLAIHSAGAYGAVHAGTYNTRPLVAEVLVDGGHFAAIRPRQTLDDLLALDIVPPWLQAN